MNSPADIRPDHLEIVQDILREYLPAGFSVWVFGSRANWTTKDSSDLDLAVEGGSALDYKAMVGLEVAFEESDLPYTVDVVDLKGISPQFKEIVEEQKVPLFSPSDQLARKGWQRVTLEDLIEVKHGYAFKGENIHDAPKSSSDILLTPGNFAVGGGFKGDRLKYYDGPVADEFILNEGDLIVTMTDLSKQSDTLGYPALLPRRPDGRRYLHNQRLGKISTVGTMEVDARYLYYVMCTAEYRNEVLASATGTTVKHTSPARIKQCSITLAPLPEQRAIAHILGTMDDKIELNRRMNQTLEAMAQALFRDWFVDFGPVRAKMAGEEPYLPPELWDLFPDNLVDSELGEIPEGWGVKSIGELADVMGGSTPSTKADEYWQEGVHCWATPKDLSKLSTPVLLDTERKITDAGLRKISSGLLPRGTVLLSSRAPIGYLAINEVPTAINQGFIALNHKEPMFNLYLFHWCKASIEEIVSHANGSTFLEVSKNNFRRIQLAVPSKQMLNLYQTTASDLHTKIVGIEKETHNLIEQRDILLPKFLAGEIGSI